jgi:aminoglycoside phosphotransferase family enzyme/gluconate kinase
MDQAAYAHPCGPVELTETHISWVLLTGDFAYKLKKPVKFAFLDFSTLERREHFCREELRCNRAFAPELYIAVLPVYRHADGSLSMGGTDGELVEWAVQMHQFDPAAQLDRLLEADSVTTGMLADFGRELAARHRVLPRLDGASDEAEQRYCGPVRDNFAEIANTRLQSKHTRLLNRTSELSDKLGKQLLATFGDRIREGFVRECHGDLHLSNLVLLDKAESTSEVTAFDCLEFNPDLRWIDTVSDVAFLFMDCHERGRADLAYAFLNAYLDASGDYRGAELLGYFAAYRSVVRAKVAALRWEQEASAATEARFVQHMEWARDWLERPRGRLILMCGLSGAGKSWVAERLAPLLPALRIRSDVARKALAGLTALARTGSPVGGGLYAPRRSDEAFGFIADVTEALLCCGENVIVDATFIEHARRAEFLALAERLGVTTRIIYCDAPVETLRARITERLSRSADPSEANLEVLESQLKKFALPMPPELVVSIDTSERPDDDRLRALAEAVMR